MKDVKRYDRDYLLGMLPNLNVTDLLAVQTLVTSLLKGRTGDTENGVGHPTGLLFEALSSHLQAIAPWSTVARTKSGKLMLTKEPLLTHFFNQHFRGWDENKVLSLAFMRMMLELLSDDLKERSVNPTFGIMVLNLNRLPEVFRYAFPGYLENHMGYIVLKKLRLSSVE